MPALLLALALAAPARHRPWRMGLVCLLLLLSHGAHLWWTVRPDAPLALPPAWADALVLLALGLPVALWWRAGLARRVTPAAAWDAGRRGVSPAGRAGGRPARASGR